MNIRSYVDSTAAKIAYWTAKNPAATRMLMVVLPMAVVVVMAFIVPTPPCGSGSGGSC